MENDAPEVRLSNLEKFAEAVGKKTLCHTGLKHYPDSQYDDRDNDNDTGIRKRRRARRRRAPTILGIVSAIVGACRRHAL